MARAFPCLINDNSKQNRGLDTAKPDRKIRIQETVQRKVEKTGKMRAEQEESRRISSEERASASKCDILLLRKKKSKAQMERGGRLHPNPLQECNTIVPLSLFTVF